MKKTLLALAVLAAAGSAQAGIELYNQDGVTVNMKGDLEVRYKKSTKENTNLVQEIDDADIGFDTRYQVNDDFQIGGYIEYSGDSSDRAQSTPGMGNTYVGFYSKSFGSLKFGRLDTQLDDAGVGSDFLFGLDSYFNDLPSGGEEAVRYDYDSGAFYFGLGYIQNAYLGNVAREDDDGNATAYYSRDHHYDVKVGARVADFDFTAFYAEAAIADLDDQDSTLALEARFGGVENLGLELGYYQSEYAGSSEKTDSFAFAADYTLDKVGFAGAVATVDPDESKDYVQWFVNVSYGIAPNTKLYAEVGGNDKDNTDTGYGFGVKAEF